jgi:bifunctional non-homologous end joining protein LigD
VFRLLKPLEIASSPFAVRPRTNQRPHWTKPVLVAQLKFTEWTDEGYLRHPIYLGLRDDVKPETVTRETGAAGAKRLRPARGAKPPSAAAAWPRER